MSVACPPIRSIVRTVLRIATSMFDRNLQQKLEQSSSRLATQTGLPLYFLYFLLVIEDKRFGRHFGVDPIAILRASIYNLGFAPKRPHGASTLTQQIYSSRLREQSKYPPTISYKFRQAMWALRTTIIDTKAAVLKRYSESVYFGKRLYGFSEAARFYCGLSANQLGIADSFFLAERIARPNTVNIARLHALISRKPIAHVLESDPTVAKRLADLYELHFHCGEVIRLCQAKHLKKLDVHMCLSSVAVSNEQ
jgi:membrane peptidoglycan carboxypeptidase